MADNVDHNLRTLDGYYTFHGMGIILSQPLRLKQLKYSRVKVTAEDITVIGEIDITFLKPKEGTFSSFRYKLPDLTAGGKAMPLKVNICCHRVCF